MCGGGCMGFANVSDGVRALGYLERDPLPAGPVALVTHSGSAFSALLRTHRRIGFTLAVSSGQELVTTTADYIDAALDDPSTRVVALLLETARAPEQLRAVVGASQPGGRTSCRAHRRRQPGRTRAGRRALRCDRRRGRVVGSADRRVRAPARAGPRRDGRHVGADRRRTSGGRRRRTRDGPRLGGRAHPGRRHRPRGARRLRAARRRPRGSRLGELLEPGLEPTNPLDVWGTGANTRELFGGCLTALAADPAVGAVALCIDLVEEYDGDESYPLAALDAAAATSKPLVVLSNIASALNQQSAARLRLAGIPVLEGTRSGLRASGPSHDSRRERRPPAHPRSRSTRCAVGTGGSD